MRTLFLNPIFWYILLPGFTVALIWNQMNDAILGPIILCKVIVGLALYFLPKLKTLDNKRWRRKAKIGDRCFLINEEGGRTWCVIEKIIPRDFGAIAEVLLVNGKTTYRNLNQLFIKK
jgi:hypothetical protein